MYYYVIAEYQRWAARGYHDPLACPRHPGLEFIPIASKEGIKLSCPMCKYSKTIGTMEYTELEKAVATAKKLFKEQ